MSPHSFGKEGNLDFDLRLAQGAVAREVNILKKDITTVKEINALAG